MLEVTKLLENVFSLKNDVDGKHKVIRFFGCKLKVNRVKLKDKIYCLKIMNDPRLCIKMPEDLTIQMAFNNDCNCKCKFCGEAIAKDNKDRQVMPEKWLYEYFLPLYPHTSNLVPTYGEITHTKEGYKYISFIQKNFPHINVFIETNGIAFNTKWAELASDNLMRVNFSINAINEEYFRKTVWDKEGIYPLVQNNFNQYLQILKNKGLFAFKPSVSCVINSSNYETVEEFIKMYVQKGIQCIIVFFDLIENHVWANQKTENNMVEQTIIKLIEIERVLKGKVFIGWRLFIPTNNIGYFDEIVNKTNIEELNEKYSELLDAARDMDLNELYKEKTKLRKKFGKKSYSYYEELSGVTFHQHIYKNVSICSNAWNHLRLRPDGGFSVCSWRPYEQNLKDYIKNDTIDWNKFFNSFYYKKLRKNFQNGCYSGCMPNCPGAEKISVNDFRKLYNPEVLVKNEKE